MAIPELSIIETGECKRHLDQAYAPPTGSPYDHFRVNVESSIDEQTEGVIRQARVAHAIGYLRAGFITPAAIDSDSFLVPEIDTARDYRPMVKYLAINNQDPDDTATATIMGPPDGGDYSSLPSMKLVWPNISPDGHRLVQAHIDKGYDIKDVSSLSGTKTPHSVRDVLRRIIQEGHTAAFEGKPEVWVFALVTGTHMALQASLTSESFYVIGDDHTFNNPDLVTPGTQLRPLLADPSKAIDNIFKNLNRSVQARDTSSARRLSSSLRYFSDGLPDEYLSQEVVMWRKRDAATKLGYSAIRNLSVE